jgi:hypothetical protein
VKIVVMEGIVGAVEVAAAVKVEVAVEVAVAVLHVISYGG